MSTLISAAAARLRTDLATAGDVGKGSGLSSFDWSLVFAELSAGWGIRTARSSVNMLQYVPPAEWPAIANHTSVTDLTAWIQPAVNALTAAGEACFFPPGKWNLTGLDIPLLAVLTGGGFDRTVLNYTPVTGSLLRCVGTAGAQRVKIVIERMSLYAATNSDGAAIDGAYFIDCEVRSVRLRNFTNNVQLVQSWNTQFIGVVSEAALQDGFNLGAESNNLTFTACRGSGNARADWYVYGSRSLDLVSCNGEGSAYGLWVAADATHPSTAINVWGGYWEGATTFEMFISSLDAGVTKPTGVRIRGAYFQPLTTDVRVAIRVADADGFEVSGCTFDNKSTFRYAYSVYFVDGAVGASGNVGSLVDRSLNKVYEGSGHVVTYSARLRAQKVWNPGTVANGTITSTTINVPGAKVGAQGTAGFNVGMAAGVALSLQVLAAGVATVTLRNDAGGPITPGAGTLDVEVRP